MEIQEGGHTQAYLYDYGLYHSCVGTFVGIMTNRGHESNAVDM